MYKALIRPLLFQFDPETIHHFSFRFLKIALAIPGAKAVARWLFVKEAPALVREVFGLRFPNPIGLAAGFDKNAELVDELACLGFGFIEIGTLTPRPQPGNDRPRLFRLRADRALINRMGFNNHGAAAAAERLRCRKSRVIVGGNLGKNKLTPNDDATADYLAAFRELHPVVDYFVVNVSSPNTPGLRDLQEKEPLTNLLNQLKIENGKLSGPAHGIQRPILLKIAPDLTDSQLDDIIDIVRETGTAGVIATNTTIRRDGTGGEPLKTDPATVQAAGAGGLSGPPVKDQSTHVIRYLVEKSGHAFPVIGVGGIETAADAREKLDAGASLVQLYTGFIYEGPGAARRICEGLSG